MERKSTLFLTRGALIAALYVVLTYFSSVLGLSSGVIQFRISEALCILPVFMPEAVIGLTVGCVLANILTGAVVWDVVFGAIATLIGALGAKMLSNLPPKTMWCATLPTIISNSLIVPAVLILAYGAPESYSFIMLTVFVGEAVCAGGLGSILYYTLSKLKIHLR